MDIVGEARSVLRAASHGEGEHERDQKNTDGIVPIEQLESVALHAFVSVRPGAPTDGARDHHEKRGADRVGCKHKSAAPLTLNPFERMACDKNRGTRSRPAPLLPVLIMGTKNGVKQIRRKKAGALLAGVYCGFVRQIPKSSFLCSLRRPVGITHGG